MRRNTMPHSLTLGCALVGAIMFAALPAHAADKKPNIVVMLMGNLGYGELGSYGGGILRGTPFVPIDEIKER